MILSKGMSWRGHELDGDRLAVDTDRGEQGHLHLPNHYGSVRVIDGQHRLFGSIKSKREMGEKGGRARISTIRPT